MKSHSLFSLHPSCRALLPGIGLALVLAAAMVPRGAQASASLKTTEDAPHTSVVQQFYDRIPAAWKPDRKVIVQEVSDEEMEEIVARTKPDEGDDDSTVDGCYRAGGSDKDDPATITLRERLSREEVAQVFAHEYGHLVWDEVLTEEERADYRRLWRERRRAGQLVTDYAAENVEEGFAEAFAHFLRKPALLRRRDSRSWQFLRDMQAEKSRP